MILENSALLRMPLPWNQADPHPREIVAEIEPTNAINNEWIPQTLGDQIWVFYEFKTPEEKETFLKSIPDKYYENRNISIMDDFSQKELDHWTK